MNVVDVQRKVYERGDDARLDSLIENLESMNERAKKRATKLIAKLNKLEKKSTVRAKRHWRAIEERLVALGVAVSVAEFRAGSRSLELKNDALILHKKVVDEEGELICDACAEEETSDDDGPCQCSSCLSFERITIDA